MNFLLSGAASISSLYILFTAFAGAADDARNNFLGFAGIFLFLYFTWALAEEFYFWSTRGRRNKQ